MNLSKLNKKLKENLYLEIDILQNLHHPHIVSLLGRTETATHIHLIMEFCQLGDLSLFIRKRSKFLTNPATAEMVTKYPNPEKGGLNEVVSRHFLKQLASALLFLRERNFIHRDVKPQNLLLLPSPQYMAMHPDDPLLMVSSVESLVPAAGLSSLPLLKLADFGFARSLPSTSLAETLCGSPLYMAPEILRYEKYDAKADLWSVGTVMYEMVTGKPPFRAANHVELLRKIEQHSDRLPWDSGIVVSDNMRSVIKGLLKKNPVERISFENFFAHEIIQENIPGLVGDDRPREIRPASRVEESESIRRQFSARESRRGASERDTRPTGGLQESSSPRGARAYSVEAHGESQRPRLPYGTPPRAQAERFHSNPVPATSRPESIPSRRPPAGSAPDRYNLEEERMERMHGAGPVDMARERSQDNPSPSPSLLNEKRKVPPHKENLRKEEREKAAQDVRDERDYVVVAKEYVEVNAFADELAANARLSGAVASPSNTPQANTTRRVQTKASSMPNQAALPPSSPTMQIAQGKQKPRQKLSYERVHGSPNSATSAITKAISNASIRLFGFSGYAPQLLRGPSPPQLYSAFSGSPGITGLITEGRPGRSSDEDVKVVHEIEELATRSDVVYGFAEVKYKQLIPLVPSMDHGLGGNDASNPDPEDDGLTPDAIVSLSEEALVLYVKALTLLAKSMAIANAWWNKKKRIEASNGATAARADNVAAGNRINNAVQWMRGRFNEVLEKAEFSRLKLMDAQRQLPDDHPGHPSNHTDESRMAGGDSSTADGVILSSGTTAEKLMYDRAIEMSRSAAINEIANQDLPGCEISYVTALRMLEAVLEKDEDECQRKPSDTQAAEKGADDAVNGINVDDRDAVKKRKLHRYFPLV